MTDERWLEIEKLLRKHVGAGTSIYLMYASPSRVKIGQALYPTRRRRTLERDLKKTVLLMGTCTASPRLEFALHHVFKDSRLDGEWFSYEPLFDTLARTFNALSNWPQKHPIWQPKTTDKNRVFQLMTSPTVQYSAEE